VKIYLNQNVYEAALERITWLFREFPNVTVGFSGGKDSTVVFHLALEVARREGRLPLRVMFVDQEAEWQATIDQVRYVMTHPDVEPRWYQMPIRLFNATSATEHWLECWSAKDEARWMRERESFSIKENVYGTDRFHELFTSIPLFEYKNEPFCYLAGVRCEESPSRYVGLTHQATYKWATWGKVLTKKLQHFTFYPIYDWSYTDVWRAIHSNGWPYNAIYDLQYRYGVQVKDMRVSNVHHETAVHALFYMQEAEPETYERLTQRISGVDMAGKLGKDDFFIYDLPSMFASWREYRDYLLEKLINVEGWKTGFRKVFERHDRIYLKDVGEEKLCRLHLQSILTNDWECIKLSNWEKDPNRYAIRKRNRRKALANEH
jgi:predicted phosphoadenosine phosphosulfate sulfurtransferase